MKILWKPAKLPPSGDRCGHGLCIKAGTEEEGDGLLVAFVEGFDWAKSGTDAVVKFDRRRFPAGYPAGQGELIRALEIPKRPLACRS